MPSFNLDDFLHKPQLPELATRSYFEVVRCVTPSVNPPHALLRTVEQLAKGLIFDHLVNVGDTPTNGFLELARTGLTGCSVDIPYVFIFRNDTTQQASLTGTRLTRQQNVLPSAINSAITEFHQRVKFDVDFINNNTVKQAAVIDLSLPYSPNLSLKETVELFRDTFATFVGYNQLAELYRRNGYAGSHIITSVTTSSDYAWNCSCKVMLVLNAFNEENAQQQAQEFADAFTNIWVNAIASVSGITSIEDMQELANVIATDHLNFTFHASAENIIGATPTVNQQLFGLERFVLDNEDLISGLSLADVVDGSLKVPELGNLTPSQLLRLACTSKLDPELRSWCVDKWLEYAYVFVEADRSFLPDSYYLYVLEYGREAASGQISQARQDYFFDLNANNDSRLHAKIPVNLFYSLINPCILDTSLLNLVERKPEALEFYVQVLLDLHNNLLGLIVDRQQLKEQGYVEFNLPAEWLHLCALASPILIKLALRLQEQEKFDPEAAEIVEVLKELENQANDWVEHDFYAAELESGEITLSPRRLVLANTFIKYQTYDYLKDMLVSESEGNLPNALFAADVYNKVFDHVSDQGKAASAEVRQALQQQVQQEAMAKVAAIEDLASRLQAVEDSVQDSVVAHSKESLERLMQQQAGQGKPSKAKPASAKFAEAAEEVAQ